VVGKAVDQEDPPAAAVEEEGGAGAVPIISAGRSPDRA